MTRAGGLRARWRRDFLRVSAAAGGGLLSDFSLPGRAEGVSAWDAEGLSPNAWIRIDPDGWVTLQVASSERGQGIMTGIAMILAEDLDADRSRVRTEFTPVDPANRTPMFGRQAAGGSTAVRGRARVHRVTGAVDCGMVVNPDSIRAQMEGAIAFGPTAALKSEIAIQDGHPVQRHFDDLPLLRIDEMPEMDVHLPPSRENPSGIGEPGMPPAAPAMANTVFGLTGEPVRSIAIRLA